MIDALRLAYEHPWATFFFLVAASHFRLIGGTVIESIRNK